MLPELAAALAPEVDLAGTAVLRRSLIAETDAGPRLLASEALRLRQVVRDLSAGHALVLLRADQVIAFDAAGLGLLLGLHRLARANGAGLVLVRPAPRLMSALRRRGLHRVLVVDTSSPPDPLALAR